MDENRDFCFVDVLHWLKILQEYNKTGSLVEILGRAILCGLPGPIGLSHSKYSVCSREPLVKCTNKSSQKEHNNWHNIFPWVVPKVTVDFPSPNRTVPFQQDRAGCTEQRKESCRKNSDSSDPANLNLPTAQENGIRSHIADKKEQAVGNTKCLLLSRQKADSLFQRRVA